jgi:hypothetical protein
MSDKPEIIDRLGNKVVKPIELTHCLQWEKQPQGHYVMYKSIYLLGEYTNVVSVERVAHIKEIGLDVIVVKRSILTGGFGTNVHLGNWNDGVIS